MMFRTRNPIVISAAVVLLGLAAPPSQALTPAQLDKLITDDPAQYDYFGESVAIDGNKAVISETAFSPAASSTCTRGRSQTLAIDGNTATASPTLWW